MEVKAQVGRTPEVSDDQIIQVGLKLEGEGSRISPWKLRNVIGAGTPARLMKVWEAYKAENGDIVAVAEVEENSMLPPEVEDNLRLMLGQLNERLEALVVQTNNAAVKAADKRNMAAYEASKQAQQNAEQELSEAEITVAQSDHKVAQLEEMLFAKEAELRDLSGQLESTKTESKGLQKQFDRATNQIDALKTNNDSLQDKFNDANISAKTAESNVDRLVGELKNTYEDLTQRTKELTLSQKSETQLETKLEGANNRVDEQSKDLDKLESKLNKVEESASEKIEELHADLTGKSEELGQANEKSQAAANALTGYKKKFSEYELIITDLKESIANKDK